jgi:acetyl esterase/lipase
LVITLWLFLLSVPVLLCQDIFPDYKNVSYGADSLQVLDFWPAKSSRKTPVLVFFHGGGFIRGEKKLDDLGVECILSYPGSETSESALDFLLKNLNKE